jgi:gas vesicle protein
VTPSFRTVSGESTVHEHETNTCLSSLLIGAFAGAGLALLLAPRPGSETRQLVSRKVREGADYARDLTFRAKERGRQLAEAAAEKSGHTVGNIAAAPAAGPGRDDSSALDYQGV